MKINSPADHAAKKDPKVEDFNKRVDLFLKDLRILSEKHRIDLTVQFSYEPMGIVPKFGFRDRKDDYEQTIKS